MWSKDINCSSVTSNLSILITILIYKKKREEKKREEEKRGKKTFPNKKISIENKSKCDFFHNSRLYRSVVKKKKKKKSNGKWNFIDNIYYQTACFILRNIVMTFFADLSRLIIFRSAKLAPPPFIHFPVDW